MPRSKGLAAVTRRIPNFTEPAYILETRDGVKLAGHDTIAVLLKNVEEKGDVRIVRTKDRVCVWPAELVEGWDAT